MDHQRLKFLYKLVYYIDFNITQVVRGSDHLTNTATQIQLIRNLNGDVPIYGHHSLLVDLSGDNLSKRLGSLSIKDLSIRDINKILFKQ